MNQYDPLAIAMGAAGVLAAAAGTTWAVCGAIRLLIWWDLRRLDRAIARERRKLAATKAEHSRWFILNQMASARGLN